MMKRNIFRILAAAAITLGSTALFAQTATGTLGATVVNTSGIALVFVTDAAGVPLGGNNTKTATANFGTISAFGPGSLAPGVTLVPPFPGPTFTVRTVFDINVLEGGLNSPGYSLTASISPAPAAGFTYLVDAVTLTTTAQAIPAATPPYAYNTNIKHNLDLTVSTGVTTSPPAETINFTATAN